jgi:hypothetical protein
MIEEKFYRIIGIKKENEGMISEYFKDWEVTFKRELEKESVIHYTKKTKRREYHVDVHTSLISDYGNHILVNNKSVCKDLVRRLIEEDVMEMDGILIKNVT